MFAGVQTGGATDPLFITSSFKTNAVLRSTFHGRNLGDSVSPNQMERLRALITPIFATRAC